MLIELNKCMQLFRLTNVLGMLQYFMHKAQNNHLLNFIKLEIQCGEEFEYCR